MKLYKAIIKNTKYGQIYSTFEIFTSEEEVFKWFKSRKEHHEYWEDYRQKESTNKSIERKPFNEIIIGLEEVHTAISF